MQTTRRAFTLGIGALPLAACVSRFDTAPPPRQEDFPAVANAGYDAWVVDFRPRASAAGISQSTLDAAFRQAGFLPGVIERDQNQAEFTRTFEDYLSIAASDERVTKGRANYARYQGLLASIEERYGVDRQVVAAVWGLESLYGERRGTAPVISALSTLAYEGRRGTFFEGQLIAALKILQAGDVTPSRMTGSWAGAMGHTQFIPTSFLAYAVDFTGDGRRDIWSDDPSDALASTASYLARSGWTRGQRWGLELRLPDGWSGPTGRGTSTTGEALAAQGVRSASGAPLTGSGSVLRPAGSGGPAFLVLHNFSVILRYNNAEFYALGVGHLSDRILGAPPIQDPFPPDANGMTKEQRLEVQQRLASAGYDVGTPDGVIGSKTQAAISAWQRAHGLAVTGGPSLDLLAALRRA